MIQQSTPPPSETPELTPAQVVGHTLVALAVAVAFWLAYRFSGAVFVLFSAMVLGTAVRPGLEWFHRRGLTRRTSAVLLYAALLAFALGAALVVLPVASSQAQGIATKVPEYLARTRSELLTSQSVTVRRLAHELPLVAPVDLTVATAGSSRAAVGVALGDLGHMARYAFFLVAILLLGFHWTYEGDVTVRALLLFAPQGRRDQVRELLEAAEEKVGGYVRGQLIVCSVTAVLSLGAFVAIGLPNALVLALVAGAMGAMPVLGGVLAAGLAVLAAAPEPHLIPWVLGAAFVIHLLQEYVVQPRVMGTQVGVHPFTILLAICGFGSLLGIAGAVLAIPMAAILQLLLDRFVFDTTREHQLVPAPDQRDRRSVLALEARTLARDACRQARSKEEGTDLELDAAKNMVESIADDLDRILTARPGATP